MFGLTPNANSGKQSAKNCKPRLLAVESLECRDLMSVAPAAGASGASVFTPNEDWTRGAYYGSRGTYFADVTGDGKADAIVVNNDTVTVRRSTGSGFSANENWTRGPYYGALGTYFADVTGDGKADAIVVNKNTVTVRRSTGSGFSAYEDWTCGPYYGAMGTCFADVTGDRNADAIVINRDTITVRRSGTPTFTDYFLTNKWGGQFQDAEKSPGDDGPGEKTGKPGCDDDSMCWAAAASNVLAWTGWGNVAKLNNNCDAIFNYFKQHWTDFASNAEDAWNWWFTGNNPDKGTADFSQVDVPGGKFFSQQSLNTYYSYSDNRAGAMAAIANGLQNGRAVALSLNIPASGGHAVTCWGYQYNSINPSLYTGIYISDSDDSKTDAAPPDRLRFYPVVNQNGSWCLQGYEGNGTSIRAVYSLARKPANVAPGLSAGTALTAAAEVVSATPANGAVLGSSALQNFSVSTSALPAEEVSTAGMLFSGATPGGVTASNRQVGLRSEEASPRLLRPELRGARQSTTRRFAERMDAIPAALTDVNGSFAHRRHQNSVDAVFEGGNEWLWG
jgi:hypothetical protein